MKFKFLKFWIFLFHQHAANVLFSKMITERLFAEKLRYILEPFFFIIHFHSDKTNEYLNFASYHWKDSQSLPRPYILQIMRRGLLIFNVQRLFFHRYSDKYSPGHTKNVDDYRFYIKFWSLSRIFTIHNLFETNLKIVRWIFAVRIFLPLNKLKSWRL